MKSRPILFSSPMVRAILNGSKSQTRRIIKPQPNEDIDRLHRGKLRERFPYQLEDENCNPCGKGFQDDQNRFWICPYGQPGDRLWVRETWQHVEKIKPCQGCTVIYRADDVAGHIDSGWRPSIFMPRWASRITLEITGVRVERVQDISETDAIAEGIEKHCPFDVCGGRGYLPQVATVTEPDDCRCADMDNQECYAALWESINGPGSWAANPWVWVVEFRRVKP